MAEEDAKKHGKELKSWDIAEYHEHSRGFLWYVLAVAAAVGLLIWAVATRNFLFAFIIIMFAVIFVTHSLRTPARYTFAVTERGIRLGGRFYPWKDIKQFWVAYEPPAVKTIYFDFGGLRPRLAVPLEDTDPNEVREILRTSITEDSAQTEEPLSDWLARVLKI